MICSVCCGTKRLVEIRCPADCTYLVSAREHPAAVVRRQQEQDVAHLLPSIRHLTERQSQLFFLFQSAIAKHSPTSLVRTVDSDVIDASAALASTLETAARGVIYEHAPQSPTAQALMTALKGVLEQVREQGAQVYDREAAIALRAIEKGAQGMATESATAYLDLMSRLLQVSGTQEAPVAPGSSPSGLILP
jgi:hypothetical protein